MPDAGKIIALEPLRAPQRWVDANVVGEALGVRPNTVYRWARDGLIPSYSFGKLRRFDLDEVLAWAMSCRRKVENRR